GSSKLKIALRAMLSTTMGTERAIGVVTLDWRQTLSTLEQFGTHDYEIVAMIRSICATINTKLRVTSQREAPAYEPPVYIAMTQTFCRRKWSDHDPSPTNRPLCS